MRTRLLLAAVLFASLAPIPVGRAPATADVIPNGRVSIANAVRFDWGPLAGQMARPAAARDGETWESFAEREAGDARWAPTIRAMNGGGSKPATGSSRTWVPPRQRAFEATTRWFSVYLESSKFRPGSDVSATGFDRVDPGAPTIDVFGHVTILALAHETIDDAARSFSIVTSPTSKASDVLARRVAPRVLIAPPITVEGTGEESSPVRRREQAWRVELPSADSIAVVPFDVKSFDAAGRPIASIQEAPSLSSSFLLVALLLVLGLGWLVVRGVRGRRGPPPVAG